MRETLIARRITVIWIATVWTLFALLTAVGLIMRLNQGNVVSVPDGLFYQLMSFHGLGMAGTFFVAAMAAMWYLLRKYVPLSIGLMGFIVFATVVGVLGLVVAFLLGNLAHGWYFLYPLSFYPTGYWPSWSVGLWIISVLILGAAWLLFFLDVLRANATRYGAGRILGWHYIAGAKEPDVPPIVIAGSMVGIDGVISIVAGLLILVPMLLEWAGTGVKSDPLMAKNMIFMFGHTLVNLVIYMVLGAIYDVLPHFTNRPWKSNRVFAIAWNATLLVVLLAMPHHLYMDFVQPLALQYIGQFGSFFATVPATAVTLLGAFLQVYRSGLRWRLTPALLYLGLFSWIVGGIGAVIDATVPFNLRLHGTLWVPAHFHTYFLMGVAMIVLGLFYHFAQEFSGLTEESRYWKLTFFLMAVGGYMFLLGFYVSGMLSVPRRYATYPDLVVEPGVFWSRFASVGVVILVLGLVFYLMDAAPRLTQARLYESDLEVEAGQPGFGA